MHPAVRLVLLLVFAAALPTLPLTASGALGAGLTVVHAAKGRAPALRRLAVAIWRLRWLLLAVAVLYAGFTEGTPLLESLPGLSREGALEGARRVLVLVDLVAAVQLLMLLTPLSELLGGLLWLLRPLRAVGLDPERLALRIGLVLDELKRLQEMPRPPGVVDAVAQMVADVEARAGQAHAPATVPMAPPAPAILQWFYPALAALLLAGLGL